MDDYTYKTQKWLEERFKMSDEQGIYFAHQPIYGFDKGHCEGGIHDRYTITHEIIKSLADFNFTNLLDVGGAEGYKAALAKKFFVVDATSSDLSSEACKRAAEIYGLKSIPSDIHSLPFKDNEFDITLCSESLEHVADWQKGINELLRVSKKAVIVTVPHESREEIDKVKEQNVEHGHIHSFELSSLDYLKSKGFRS